MPFDEAFTDLVLEQMLIDPEINNIIKNDDNYWETIRKGLRQGQISCNTPSLVLQYCYTYLHTHFDAYQSMLTLQQPRLEEFCQAVFGPERRVLMVDFGCGPMTCGLALADYGRCKYGQPPNLVYIGIDNQPCMLQKASEFASRSNLFGNSFVADFKHMECGAEWSLAEIQSISQHAEPGITLVFNFSYLFGQESVNYRMAQMLGRTVRNIVRECGVQKIYSVYLNAPYLPTRSVHANYHNFLDRLMRKQFRPDITREFPRTVYRYRAMRGLNVQVYQRRQNEFTYEVLPIPLEAV
jgi:hypothetical protein